MGGCLRVRRAGARAAVMAPPAEALAATAATLRISTRRVGTAVLQSTLHMNSFLLKQALQTTYGLLASRR